jgi:hypothetical protein
LAGEVPVLYETGTIQKYYKRWTICPKAPPQAGKRHTFVSVTKTLKAIRGYSKYYLFPLFITLRQNIQIGFKEFFQSEFFRFGTAAHVERIPVVNFDHHGFCDFIFPVPPGGGIGEPYGKLTVFRFGRNMAADKTVQLFIVLDSRNPQAVSVEA